jgi:hypothetical protein
LIPVEQLHSGWVDCARLCPTPIRLRKVLNVRNNRKAMSMSATYAVPVRLRTVGGDVGDTLSMPCRGRRCPHCGPHHWLRRTKACMLAGLKARPGEVLFVTLTAPGIAGGLDSTEAIEAWNAGAAKRWNHFITILRRTFPGARIEFFRVGELQERGAVHYHNAIAGLQWLPKAVLRRLALRAGFGRIVDVRRLRNVGGGCAYFAKYMLKDADKWPSGRRVWSCSAKWRDRRLWAPHLGKLPGGTYVVSTSSGTGVDGAAYVSVSPWEYAGGGGVIRQDERTERPSQEFEDWVRRQHMRSGGAEEVV